MGYIIETFDKTNFDSCFCQLSTNCIQSDWPCVGNTIKAIDAPRRGFWSFHTSVTKRSRCIGILRLKFYHSFLPKVYCIHVKIQINTIKSTFRTSRWENLVGEITDNTKNKTLVCKKLTRPYKLISTEYHFQN